MAIPTVVEVLKQSGVPQEKIDSLDAQYLSGLTTYVSNIYQTAEQKEKAAQEAAAKAEADRKAQEAAAEAARVAQEAAQAAERGWSDFRDNVFNPSVLAMEAEKSRLAKEAADARAEAAYYKAQRESYLSNLGIKPDDAPVFPPTVVAPVVDPNKTPGTPTFTINDVRDQLGTSLGTVANIQWEYQTLYGKPMPISPTELLRQSEANKFKDPATYANQIFKFSEKREELRQAQAKAHDDEIAKKAAEEKENEWKAKLAAREAEIAAEKKKIAEGQGNNPDVKLPPGSAKYAELQRATKAGERPDPLKMSQQQRRQNTLDNIHKALEERQAVVA